MFLIVGLGNPGKQYEMTRHNVGFETIDYLSNEYGIKVNKLKHKALIGEGFVGNEKIILAKPQTYMNLSGESVRDMCEYYKLSPDNIIIIYDDISIPSGSVRIRGKGSAGGHNGIKSIIYQLKSDEFMRIKLGVGAPKNANYDLKDYVLGHFSKEEIASITSAIKLCPDALAEMMKNGAASAASKYNKTIKEANVQE